MTFTPYILVVLTAFQSTQGSHLTHILSCVAICNLISATQINCLRVVPHIKLDSFWQFPKKNLFVYRGKMTQNHNHYIIVKAVFSETQFLEYKVQQKKSTIIPFFAQQFVHFDTQNPRVNTLLFSIMHVLCRLK